MTYRSYRKYRNWPMTRNNATMKIISKYRSSYRKYRSCGLCVRGLRVVAVSRTRLIPQTFPQVNRPLRYQRYVRYEFPRPAYAAAGVQPRGSIGSQP